MTEIGWCLIPPYIMVREDLSLTQKILYGRILGLTKEKGYCYASNSWLGKQIGISKQTVANNLSEMKKKMLLTLDPIRNEEGIVTKRRIYISEIRLPQTVIPLTANGNTPLPHSVNRILEKSIDYSNNQQADDNKDFSQLKSLIGKEFPRRGASHEWQDYAVRMWNNLRLAGDPSSSWFKLFKDAFKVNRRGLIDATFATVSDVGATNPEKYFYKVFNQKINGDN